MQRLQLATRLRTASVTLGGTLALCEHFAPIRFPVSNADRGPGDPAKLAGFDVTRMKRKGHNISHLAAAGTEGRSPPCHQRRIKSCWNHFDVCLPANVTAELAGCVLTAKRQSARRRSPPSFLAGFQCCPRASDCHFFLNTPHTDHLFLRFSTRPLGAVGFSREASCSKVHQARGKRSLRYARRRLLSQLHL